MKKYPKTVATIVYFGDKIALAKRLNTHTYSGYWEVPGGKVDPTDENIQKAASREIQEEMNYFVHWTELELVDCAADESTDYCFIFKHWTASPNFHDVGNKERNKRTHWKLFTKEEALKLDLMPGIKENL